METIPWEKVDIETLTIEVEHSNSKKVVDFMESKGYVVQERIENVDIFFVKKR